MAVVIRSGLLCVRLRMAKIQRTLSSMTEVSLTFVRRCGVVVTWGVGWVAGWVVQTIAPVQAAERLAVRYRAWERSIPIASLAQYAATGDADDELSAYLDYLPASTRDRLPALLSTPLPIEAVEASQFLYSPQGEFLLQRLSVVFSTDASDRSHETTFKGLRGAIVAAANSPTGLTPIALLEAFPTRTLYLKIGEAIAAADSVRETLNSSQAELSRLEAIAALAPPAAAEVYDRWQTLQQPGHYTWRIEPIELRDRTRNFPYGHRINADLYRPTDTASRRGTNPSIPIAKLPPTPLIVISHGVGSDRRTFYYLAEYLASQGFAVLVPEHAGSNAKHLQALLRGSENEIAKPSEFDDRPRDISLLLDEVTRRIAFDSDLVGQIDPSRTIVIGHSFGGYTALALAGATIATNSLQQTCTDLDQQWSWNLSLLLQCRLLTLVNQEPLMPRWRDERVRGLILISPIGGAMFDDHSLAELDLPVLILAGTADTIAPAYLEQIPLFERLPMADRQLVLWQGGTHFSSIAVPPGEQPSISLPASLVGPDPRIAHRHLEAISLAFARAHLMDNPDAQALLTPSALTALGNATLPIVAIDSAAFVSRLSPVMDTP